MSYVDMRGMPSRDQVLAHYAEVSGRQVDDIDYYVVLAKWKLAIVLEQGFQRAGDDEKLLAFGPVITDLMRFGRRTRRVHATTAVSHARRGLPGVRPAGGRPRRGRPSPPSRRDRSACRSTRRRSTSLTCC